MAGTIGSVAGATDRGLTKIACVSTEAALVDSSIGGTVERQAPMLQLIDSINGLASEDFCRRLVNQIAPPLHGIIHMPFPMVLFLIAQRSCHTTLGCTGMGARRVDLRE